MSKFFRITIFCTFVFFLNACGGGSSTPVSPPNTDTPTTAGGSNKVKDEQQAAKFLTRATFGATQAGINEIVAAGTYQDWINSQFSVSPSYHLPRVKYLSTLMCSDTNDEGEKSDSWEIRYPRHQTWWEIVTKGNDQLRQRVAFALSEILVVSDSDGLGLSDYQLGITSYYDVLVKHAFGNYRNLLEEVTLHPAMGDFLSMSRNQKANEDGTIRPDENYAREALQLFSIGVHELNIDGTNKLDSSNQPIPTYNQKTIEEFAKVFTGWSYADKEWNRYAGNADRTLPLKAFEEYHDTSAKNLLNGEQSPSDQTALEDIQFALDNIFKHPNIAPFISKQLIKRLVTSNPSPAYVARVAEKFNDNGDGVKGDMKAVITAILLDQDALAETQPPNFGKLREPLLRMSHLWRAFNMQTSWKTGRYWDSSETCGQSSYPAYIFYGGIDSFASEIGQGPLQARSVFNFFRPDFTPTGILNENGLSAPEFQIINENTLVGATNLFHLMVERFSTSEGFNPLLDDKSMLDFREVTTLAADTTDLLNYLNLVLLNNEMSSSLNDILTEHLNQEDVYAEGREGQLQKAREAIMLIISSPEYLIQR